MFINVKINYNMFIRILPGYKKYDKMFKLLYILYNL